MRFIRFLFNFFGMFRKNNIFTDENNLFPMTEAAKTFSACLGAFRNLHKRKHLFSYKGSCAKGILVVVPLTLFSTSQRLYGSHINDKSLVDLLVVS